MTSAVELLYEMNLSSIDHRGGKGLLRVHLSWRKGRFSLSKKRIEEMLEMAGVPLPAWTQFERHNSRTKRNKGSSLSCVIALPYQNIDSESSTGNSGEEATKIFDRLSDHWNAKPCPFLHGKKVFIRRVTEGDETSLAQPPPSRVHSLQFAPSSDPQTLEDKLVHDAYDHIADEFSRTRGFTSSPAVRQYLKTLQEDVRVVLDVGCGNGTHLCWSGTVQKEKRRDVTRKGPQQLNHKLKRQRKETDSHKCHRPFEQFGVMRMKEKGGVGGDSPPVSLSPDPYRIGVGLDRCLTFCQICSHRGEEVMRGDALQLPLRVGCVDAM